MSDKEREELPTNDTNLVWHDFFNASSQMLYFEKMAGRYRRRLGWMKFFFGFVLGFLLTWLFYVISEDSEENFWFAAAVFLVIVSVLYVCFIPLNRCRNQLFFCNDAYFAWGDIAARFEKMYKAISFGEEASPEKITVFSKTAELMSVREKKILGNRKLKLVKAAEQETRKMLEVPQKTGQHQTKNWRRWLRNKLTGLFTRKHPAERLPRGMDDKESKELPTNSTSLVWHDFFTAFSRTLYFGKMVSRYHRRFVLMYAAIIIMTAGILLYQQFILSSLEYHYNPWLVLPVFASIILFYGVVGCGILIALNRNKNRLFFCKDAHFAWGDIAARLEKMHKANVCGEEISPEKIMVFSKIAESISAREKKILGNKNLKLVKAFEQEAREMLEVPQNE